MFGIDDPNAAAAVETYVKLLRAARAVTARVEPRLTAYGLTTTQLGVLEAILHKGPLTHRELGRKVLTSAANMTDVIDKLEARGLVLRVRCPNDRRQVKVEMKATIAIRGRNWMAMMTFSASAGIGRPMSAA